MGKKVEEVNYKKNFCLKYFGKDTWDLDVLNGVDVLLRGKRNKNLLYIEAKDVLTTEGEKRKARAQAIITNKKQDSILEKVALIYRDRRDENANDFLELLDCSDNSVLWNNDINWEKERACTPSKDAINRINDRLTNHIQLFQNEQIKEFYHQLKEGNQPIINVTENNFNVVFSNWKNAIKFKEEIQNEQDLINLFLADLLNNTKYKTIIKKDSVDLFPNREIEQDLIREGTNLNKYELLEKDGQIHGIIYSSEKQSLIYQVKDEQSYHDFWATYKRPPEREEFLKILERSATLYTEKYRRTVGGEYTPSCFVKKQVEILTQHYDMNDYIVFDPCAGVGNLENEFGKDYKEQCYLSTLEQMDVDICKIKDFGNSIQYDYLVDNKQPKFNYHGTELSVDEICKRENKKLMVIMNPPYQRQAGRANNLAIEFFNKVLKLDPQVIVFYYTTESFLKDEIDNYINSGYKIVSHIFSNAKDTFLLKKWPISQVIFDKDKGSVINKIDFSADRYEYENINGTKDKDLVFKGTYKYNLDRPNLMKEIQAKISENETGETLGSYSYLSTGYSINLTNKTFTRNKLITTNNIKYCLIQKGLIINTHNQYFERNQYMYKGTFEDIPTELQNDAIIFALFYKNCAFTNKGQKNYIMPFSARELGCSTNDLNILQPDTENYLIPNKEKPFDFRELLNQLELSKEAVNLRTSALKMFKYYHSNSEYNNKDWNDSYYDLTNAFMNRTNRENITQEPKKNRRIVQTQTTKNTQGFKLNLIKKIVEEKDYTIFEDFFNYRRVLAEKINQELLDNHLLLWQRSNLF